MIKKEVTYTVKNNDYKELDSSGKFIITLQESGKIIHHVQVNEKRDGVREVLRHLCLLRKHNYLRIELFRPDFEIHNIYFLIIGPKKRYDSYQITIHESSYRQAPTEKQEFINYISD